MTEQELEHEGAIKPVIRNPVVAVVFTVKHKLEELGSSQQVTTNGDPTIQQ